MQFSGPGMAFVWDERECMNFLRMFPRSQAIQVQADLGTRKL